MNDTTITPIGKHRRFVPRISAPYEERRAQRGQGMAPASAQFLAGARLALAMLEEARYFGDCEADLDQQFRDGPQANFAAGFIARLREGGDLETDEGFAAVLSHYIALAQEMVGTDYIRTLIEGAQQR